jgi:hypothetical protein
MPGWIVSVLDGPRRAATGSELRFRLAYCRASCLIYTACSVTGTLVQERR